MIVIYHKERTPPGVVAIFGGYHMISGPDHTVMVQYEQNILAIFTTPAVHILIGYIGGDICETTFPAPQAEKIQFVRHRSVATPYRSRLPPVCLPDAALEEGSKSSVCYPPFLFFVKRRYSYFQRSSTN